MTPKEVKEIFEHDMAHAEACLYQSGKLIPMFVLRCEDAVRVVGAPWSGDEEKDQVANFIRLLGVAHNAHVISLLSEAWIRSAQADPNLSDAENMRAAENAPREEMVWLNITVREARGVIRHFHGGRGIQRDEAGKFAGLAKLDANEITDSEIEGRFTTLVAPEEASAELRAMAKLALERFEGAVQEIEITPPVTH